MADLNAFYPDIKLEVEGCPLSVMNRVIVQILRHFCRETWYWLHDIAALTLLPHVDDAPQTWLYQLDVPDGAEVLAIDEIMLDGRTLPMKSDQWLDERLPGWRNAVGTPLYYLMLPDHRLRLVPAADQLAPLAVAGRVALMPVTGATTFGDCLLDYDSGLASGMLARLLSMNKPWANGQRAQVCQAEYLDAVSDARAKVMQRFSAGPETVYQRSWL